MRYATKALIASVLAGTCLWAGVLAMHADPAEAYVPGPVTAYQAEKRVESAKLAVRRAKARLREARRVLAATRRISASYGTSTGRWVQLARRAGWPWGAMNTLGLLIYRESRGDPQATNPTTGCAGLLQIHPVHGLGERAYIPYTNLRFGLRLYREQGTVPWGI